MSDSCDVVVVGAGLAGLYAATHLARAGLDVVVVERAAHVGGRVATDLVDGFRLDRGFQLYNPAYPEGRRAFDLDALDLRPFARGVEVFPESGGDGVLALQPSRTPATLITAVRGTAGRPWNLAALISYAARCAAQSPQSLAGRPDIAIGQALASAGVGDRGITELMAPFLSGVFADPDLATSRRYADLVLRSFVRGVPGVPAAGMAALPAQLAARLPGNTLRLNERVRGVTGSSVATDSGEIGSRAVVVATPAHHAAELIPGLRVPPMRALTTWYFRTRADLGDRRMLMVGTSLRPLASIAVLSAAAPTYAPAGWSLLAASAVGFHPDAAAARDAAAAVSSALRLPAAELAEIARYPIRHALPAAVPPFALQQPVELGEGLFVIGDHRDTPSIQGALVSGKRGAAQVLRHLRKPLTPARRP